MTLLKIHLTYLIRGIGVRRGRLKLRMAWDCWEAEDKSISRRRLRQLKSLRLETRDGENADETDIEKTEPLQAIQLDAN